MSVRTDAFKGLVRRLVFAYHGIVIGVFDIDGGDVVGQQDNFVGVYFVLVFAGQVLLVDQSALQEARDKGAGAGEGVEDVNIFIGRVRSNSFFNTSLPNG